MVSDETPAEQRPVDQRGRIEGPSRLAVVWEYVWTLLVMGLLVLGARSSLADWYEVPSGSMLPTILEGDRIFVNKLAYNLRVPFTKIEVVSLGELKRGDIVVFLYPVDGVTDYVKRLVGLPGDEISVIDDILYINGKPMPRRPARPTDLPPGVELEPGRQVFVEDLMGVEHLVYETNSYQPKQDSWVVQENAFFAMGDNRDNSSDSRVWGNVPMEFLKGRAVRVVLSIEKRRSCARGDVSCYLSLFDPRRFRLERSFQSLYEFSSVQPAVE